MFYFIQTEYSVIFKHAKKQNKQKKATSFLHTLKKWYNCSTEQIL